MSRITPMMAQYRELKSCHQNSILFFRLGDFYEMFDRDAKEASKLLDIALTQRNGTPMCGIPHHAARSYISRLLKLGKNIAICEQTTQSSAGRGLVPREVVEVITPGTIVDEELIGGAANNYLVAISCPKKAKGDSVRSVAIAALDLSTGEFRATSFPVLNASARLADELFRLSPQEILVQESMIEEMPDINRILQQHSTQETSLQKFPDWRFDITVGYQELLKIFGTENLKAFGLHRESVELSAAGLIVSYVYETAHSSLRHVKAMTVYHKNSFVILDEGAQRSLELVRNFEGRSQEHTLLSILDHTQTSMGARLLHRRILEPSLDLKMIRNRLEAVEVLYHHQNILNDIRIELSASSDLERIAGRISLSRADARDLRRLVDTVTSADNIVAILSRCQQFKDESELKKSAADTDQKGFNTAKTSWETIKEPLERIIKAVKEVSLYVTEAVVDDPPSSINDGGIIRNGYDSILDDLRSTIKNAENLLNSYLEEERVACGIMNLKLRHNRVLGWFLEVTAAQARRVPNHFLRRQSLVGAERFTTKRLEELDGKIAVAGAEIRELERDIFFKLREKIAIKAPLLTELAHVLAAVDVSQGLALAAIVNGYTRPQLVESGNTIIIDEGRHPMVESMLPAGSFVPNEIHLEHDGTRFIVLTGPNMAGKSTYLRQTALIVLMAQIGSFVPARAARLSLVDGIFCRIGTSDNIVRGESTFLVEMNETARILRTATAHSLVILDEIGRGTSTEDGSAIAMAVCEYLLDTVKAKTLFATHLKELAQIHHPNSVSFTMEVAQNEKEIIFLKRVVPGITAHSYGVHAAALAGVPVAVVNRAQSLIENGYPPRSNLYHPGDSTRISNQKTLLVSADTTTTNNFRTEQREACEAVSQEIEAIDVDTTSPLKALTLIARLQKKIQESKNR